MPPHETKECFRTPILNKKKLFFEDVKDDYMTTDLFIVEVASRIAYRFKGKYVHHILYDYYPENQKIIQQEFLSDQEIIDDILKMKQELHAPLIIVGHIVTYERGARYDLLKLLERTCEKYQIPFIDPAKEIAEEGFDINELVLKDKVIMNYNDAGHIIMRKIYKKFINRIFTPRYNETREEIPYCVHKYLTKCKTNPQPPGFGDFLRGTVALYDMSRMYSFEMYLDSQHPIFQYLKPNKWIRQDKTHADVIELLYPTAYDVIYQKMEDLFRKRKPFTIMTHSLYRRTEQSGEGGGEKGDLVNYGKINHECKEFLKDLLTPCDDLENKIEFIFQNVYGISNNPVEKYNIIHLRFGDAFIHNNIYMEEFYHKFYKKIAVLVESTTERYVLITDSSSIAKKLTENIAGLSYWDNAKIHLGDLRRREDSPDDAVFDTLIDFFIMSRAAHIYSSYSGFSVIASEIYDIPYTVL